MTRTIRLAACFSLLSLAVACISARADAAAPEDAEKTLSPYFLVEGGDPAVDKLPLKDTRVDVAVAGVIADVTVRQTYENRGTRPIHAHYLFPASTRAAVYGLTMQVGAERIVARIEEREKAKADFVKAKQAGKSASLLEEQRPNVFTMDVANILPNDVIAVELKYTELLVPDAGTYELVYPTVVGPRYSSTPAAQAEGHDTFVASPYLHEGEPPPSAFHFTAKVSGGVPIQSLESPGVPLAVAWDGPTRASLTLPESERFAGNRDVVVRYRLSGDEVSSGLMLQRGADESFFLLTVQPPRAPKPETLPPREYVFVLDVSGSMNGFPLDTAKGLLAKLVHGLRPVDRFDVVLFADGSNVLATSSLPATSANLARALSFIGPQSGGGGTELLAALRRAQAIPHQEGMARSVVLITDGYIDAEKAVFGYVRDQLDRASFFAFGIGTSVNRYLIEGIAKAGQGEPLVVTGPAEAGAAAEKFRATIESPVLTDVRVTFDGFDAYDVEPAKVPDLFVGRPIVVYGKWRGDPKGTATIDAKSGTSAFHASYAVDDTALRGEHQALGFLWARARIAEISDYGSDTLAPEPVARVTDLGLRYHLLTRYTSFVAVHEVVRTAVPGADVAQPSALPAGVSDLAVGDAVATGSEPDLLWIAACLALVVAAGCRQRARRAGLLAAPGAG